MSDDPTSWFHCARCGALFRAPLGRVSACESCGENPSLGVAVQAAKAVPAKSPPLRTPAASSPHPHQPAFSQHPGKERRHKKSGAPLPMLIAFWVIPMLLVAIAGHWFMNATDTPEGEWRPAEKLSPEETALLEAHASNCQSLFGLVLANQTPESLSPFVLNKLDTLTDMARFYRLNPLQPEKTSHVVKSDASVIRLPEGLAIEGRWELEDGRLFDVIFRRENDEWLVDWHHFVRYSSHPWPLFLAGDGPDVGEFRLLVRRRLGLDVFKEKEDPESPLEFVFHAPQFGRPDAPGPASPVFVLERESVHARRLMLGFEQYRSGDRPFRALLPAVEPDDEMMRVRVVIRRIDDTGGRRFELEEIKAFHWLQHDDPGLSFEKDEAVEP